MTVITVVVVMHYDDDDARTGFDTAYMVTNEETTGLLSYVGEKHTTVQYDQTLYQVYLVLIYLAVASFLS